MSCECANVPLLHCTSLHKCSAISSVGCTGKPPWKLFGLLLTKGIWQQKPMLFACEAVGSSLVQTKGTNFCQVSGLPQENVGGGVLMFVFLSNSRSRVADTIVKWRRVYRAQEQGLKVKTTGLHLPLTD